MLRHRSAVPWVRARKDRRTSCARSSQCVWSSFSVSSCHVKARSVRPLPSWNLLGSAYDGPQFSLSIHRCVASLSHTFASSKTAQTCRARNATSETSAKIAIPTQNEPATLTDGPNSREESRNRSGRSDGGWTSRSGRPGREGGSGVGARRQGPDHTAPTACALPPSVRTSIVTGS